MASRVGMSGGGWVCPGVEIPMGRGGVCGYVWGGVGYPRGEGDGNVQGVSTHCLYILDMGSEIPTLPPLVLTPSGSHQNTYGWQAGGTHPTGMLSCIHVDN